MSLDSPYHPGFGARPAVLVGRERMLARAAANLTRTANSRAPSSSALVVTGARGLGKTVTLDVIADLAAERGFLTATVTLDSVSDDVRLLAGQLAEAIAPLEGRGTALWARVKDRLASLSVEINAGVVKVGSTRPRDASDRESVSRRQQMAGLLLNGSQLAAEHGHAGLAVLVDELQEAPHDQLVVIANAVQDALRPRDAGPLAIFAAGLPHTPDRVMAAASFTERLDFRVLDRFDAGSAERALLEPALNTGVSWETAAAAAVLDAAAGSPYLIQRFGDEAWTYADPGRGETIGVDHAREAIADVTESLHAGMFRGRWAKASPGEQDLMIAIAQVVDVDGISRTAHITALLGKTTSQLSTTRHALIDKGLVEPAGRGQLRFTTAGFDDFVRQHTGAVWYGPHHTPTDLIQGRLTQGKTSTPAADLPPGNEPPHHSPGR